VLYALLRKRAVNRPHLRRAALTPIPEELRGAVLVFMGKGRRMRAVREIRLVLGCSFQEARDIAYAIHYGMVKDGSVAGGGAVG
jgi:hypothetical protein